MLWSEFQVICLTSALTFQVAGCLKEVLTICVAVIIFEDLITPTNGLGLALVIFGSLMYKLGKSGGPAPGHHEKVRGAPGEGSRGHAV
jgi:hypothetical protein